MDNVGLLPVTKDKTRVAEKDSFSVCEKADATSKGLGMVEEAGHEKKSLEKRTDCALPADEEGRPLLSKKQWELLYEALCGGLKRLNILEGSVRSGKTWISLVLWALWVSQMPKDGHYLMCAKTLDSLKRNCLSILEELAGKKYFSYSVHNKEAVLMGRKIYLESASDARAEQRIRGMTLYGVYCDEITLFPQDFFSMLLSRLSAAGAKLIGTTNPDSPEHWLKKRYLDRAEELDLYSAQFLIDDNIFLSKRFVENLKKEYTGVFYERFIRGAWVNAEGLVYPNFSEERHIVRGTVEHGGDYYISIDYGTLNPCSMGLWQVDWEKERAVRLREFYYDGRQERRQMTDEEYYRQLEILAGDLPVRQVVIDPSAASFIACIRRQGRFAVKKADNKVIDGIRLVFSYIAQDKLLFHESCRGCLSEFRSYVWDEEAQTDSVVKANDHAMDDVRYFCNTILRRRFRT